MGHCDLIELILKSFHHASRIHLGRELPDSDINYFSVETLEYTTSFRPPFDDLVFYGGDLHLLDSIGQLAQWR
jgi:hypothetical protein